MFHEEKLEEKVKKKKNKASVCNLIVLKNRDSEQYRYMA